MNRLTIMSEWESGPLHNTPRETFERQIQVAIVFELRDRRNILTAEYRLEMKAIERHHDEETRKRLLESKKWRFVVTGSGDFDPTNIFDIEVMDSTGLIKWLFGVQDITQFFHNSQKQLNAEPLRLPAGTTSPGYAGTHDSEIGPDIT